MVREFENDKTGKVFDLAIGFVTKKMEDKIEGFLDTAGALDEAEKKAKEIVFGIEV